MPQQQEQPTKLLVRAAGAMVALSYISAQAEMLNKFADQNASLKTVAGDNEAEKLRYAARCLEGVAEVITAADDQMEAAS